MIKTVEESAKDTGTAMPAEQSKRTRRVSDAKEETSGPARRVAE